MDKLEAPVLKLNIETITKEIFQRFKNDARIYFATEGFDKKPQRIQVDILKNLIGTDIKRIYNLSKDLKNNVENINYVFRTLENYLDDKNDNLLLYEFFARKQKSCETFSDFYADLKKLILFCKFGNQKNKLLKAQIILGIKSKTARKKIIEENLCLEDIILCCRDFERQRENGAQFPEDEETNSIQNITVKPEIDSLNSKTKLDKGNSNSDQNCTVTSENITNYFLETNQIYIKEERDPFGSDDENYTRCDPAIPEVNMKVEDNPEIMDTINAPQIEQIICEICSKVFKSQYNLRVHKRRTHKLDLPKMIRVKKITDLTCPTCQKVFASTNSYRGHQKIHLEKNYICEICSKGFTQRCTLETHIRRHKGDPDKECEICHHKFYRNSELNTHMRRAHTNDKPYCCEICGIQLRTKVILKYHMRIHTGERPYKCDLCPKDFRLPNSLRNHRRIHTGERNYVCQICNRAFTEKGQLKTHMKTHKDRDPQELTRALNIIKIDSRYSLANQTMNENSYSQL